MVREIWLHLLEKELIPFFDKTDIRNAIRITDDRFFSNKNGEYIPIEPFFDSEIFHASNPNPYHFLIVGPSGMGKTSLLLRIFSQYRRNHFFSSANIRLLSLNLPESIDMIRGHTQSRILHIITGRTGRIPAIDQRFSDRIG